MYWKKEQYFISDNPEEVNIDYVHQFLSQESYWSRGISRKKVVQCVENSLNFSVFHEKSQIGYARVISDCTSFAYLCDVFIATPHRNKGIANWLTSTIRQHKRLQNLRRWLLVTSTAHDLYKKHHFTPLAEPEAFMELHDNFSFMEIP